MIRKLFWNLVLIIGIIAGLYYFKIWPFKENVAGTEYLKNKYCNKQDAPKETAICDCIVRAAELDMQTRFSKSEMVDIQGDRAKSAYALQKSLKAIKSDAQRCLEQQGQETAWNDFVSDLSTLDNPILKKAKSFLSDGAEKVENIWNDSKDGKKQIDSKYK
jgi:hypothetical protein